MKQGLTLCESHLELHPKGVRDIDVGIVYQSIKDLSEDRGCYDCLNTYKCKFVEKVSTIIETSPIKRKPVGPNNIAFNK